MYAQLLDIQFVAGIMQTKANHYFADILHVLAIFFKLAGSDNGL